MKLLLPIVHVIFFLAIADHGVAQTQGIKFNRVIGANGISLGKISSLVQDKYGFMWLSDQNNQCIVRFDGRNMIRFKTELRNPNSLGGTNPEWLAIDSLGNIWIAFYGTGLDRFNPETETFTHFRHDPSDPSSLSNDVVSVVHVDHLGNVWVGTNEGLDLLDQTTGKFTHYRHKTGDSTSLSYDLVRAIYEDKAGTLWVGTGMVWENNTRGGLNRFNRDTGNFTRYLSDPSNPQTLTGNKVRAIFEDSRGTFWIGTDGDGLHTMDRKTGIITRLKNSPANPDQLSRPPVFSSDDHITFITEDAKKRIWIGTLLNGLVRFDPVSGNTIHFGKRGDQEQQLKDSSTWCAYTSNDGLIWLATQSAKLYTIEISNNLIPQVRINGFNSFLDLAAENANTILLGTVNGLVRQDLSNGTINRFLIEPNNLGSGKNIVQKIYQDKGGSFWIGTSEGLYLFDPKINEFTYHVNDENNTNPGANNVINLFQDTDSSLWIGTVGGGLRHLDLTTGKFTDYKHIEGDTTSISTDITSTIARDKVTGDLWVGTAGNVNEGGLNRITKQGTVSRTYLHGRSILDFFQDATGTIWVGSVSGLYQYDKVTDSFYALSEKFINFEMPLVSSITEDDQHNLWIGSNIGIIKLNDGRDQITTFGIENGIDEAGSLSFASVLKRDNGELLFGSHSGYYVFDPEKINTTDHKTSIYVTGFWINSEEIKTAPNGPLQESITDANDIQLNYDQNVFSLRVSAIDFRNSNAIIRYKLENYDQDWRSAEPDDRIEYFKVPPGSYTFRLRSQGTEKTLSITILPPWWKTTFAYVGYGLLLIGSVYTVAKIQNQRVIRAEREKTRERELEQKKEIEKAYLELKATQKQLIQSEKMASLGELTAGIAHEIQNPLNFVNNFSEVNAELISEMKEELSRGNIKEAATIADGIAENEEKIIYHGKRADAIVKGMLQHSRSSNGQKEPTDINALADEYLRLAYHGLRAKDKSFNARLKTDLDPAVVKINVAPQDIGRVMLNLINNAFYAVSQRKLNGSHNGEHLEPTVTLKSKRINSQVVVSVTDNGTGIPKNVLDKIFQPFFTTKPTGEGTGLGLSLSYDIITKGHDGEIKVDTVEGHGTTFTIVLPV
jgi:signal transduction histidine kinase/ligand-binding sensor domain-containing protein